MNQLLEASVEDYDHEELADLHERPQPPETVAHHRPAHRHRARNRLLLSQHRVSLPVARVI